MNQDSYLVDDSFASFRLYVVADGMGGHRAGEVASDIAVQTVHTTVRSGLRASEFEAQELLCDAIYQANQNIYQSSLSNPDYQGMGTTVVCTLVSDEEIVVAHVGDSRAYVYKDGRMVQITKDHSLVGELVRRGQLTEDEAFYHPQRNIVTRSVGTLPQTSADVSKIRWGKGDVFLLCSDGLSDFVRNAEVEAFLSEAASMTNVDDLDKLSDRMIHLALERGGRDNITVIVGTHVEAGDQP